MVIQLQPDTVLEDGPFRAAKLRIEKVQRIAADLKTGGQRARQRLEELEAVEAVSFQRPSGTAKEEVFVDACGWSEARVRMRYVAKGGDAVTEDLVIFQRALGAETLTVKGGNAPLIPTSLFDARMISRKHGVPAPHRKREIRMVPRIDGRGAFLGVFSVMIDTP